MKTYTEQDLRKLLREAIEHLEFCGYGDKYERECSEELRKKLDEFSLSEQNNKAKK